MPQASITIVLPGTKVRYHGSISERHGEMVVEAFNATPDYAKLHEGDLIRYVLRYGDSWREALSNVRPESFTPSGSLEDLARSLTKEDTGYEGNEEL